MWDYIELFYHEQGEEATGYVNEAFLQNIAQQVQGLNLSQWSSDRSDAKLQESVSTDAQSANNAGFTGTPSFLLGKTGETMSKYEYQSLTDPAPWNEAIEKLIKS